MQLDRIYQKLARDASADFGYLNYPTVTDPDLLASDGYHPSPKGYAFIADAIASSIQAS